MHGCMRTRVCMLFDVNYADWWPRYLSRYRTMLWAGRPKICASNFGGVNKYLCSLNLPAGQGPTQFHRYICFLCIYFQKDKIQTNINLFSTAARCKGRSNCDVAIYFLSYYVIN